ncbi:MAG: hypothetical protein KI791_00260 [Cyclobacteriaceae bacterium]|nr:hypothetical protein [Cyclobacteriaceae bacterium SS2]
MSVRRKIDETNGIYFITFTCYRWLHLFEICNAYDAIYKWFDHLKENNHYILGYVIMPNHMHALIAFTHSDKIINTTIGNGKRFLAYELVNLLKVCQEYDVLEILKKGVLDSDRKAGKKHQVFEPSFDWKECYSNWFIEQKLNYIHNNPCVGKWNLAASPSEYVHSSAKFYLEGIQGIYPVKNYLELEEIDLTKPVKSNKLK